MYVKQALIATFKEFLEVKVVLVYVRFQLLLAYTVHKSKVQ
jgi:hypothetical protein